MVERAPGLRKTGGHAIDLFRPAMEISERMGVLPRIEARATGTEILMAHRPWSSRPARIDYLKIEKTMSDRHVEIMRDDLSEIYYDAARDDVQYIFGDHIASISGDGDVTFAHAAGRRFDIVVGADGLHSGVRQLVFGDVPQRFLGGYLSVVSVPKSLAHNGEMTGYFQPDRVAMVYTADHLDDARAVFIFRPKSALDFDHRDVARQKKQLRAAFAGIPAEVDTWLDEVGRTPTFYFDAITQLEMAEWSRGRVTLVGDAGYCPGPAVGGSTSLAVYGAYVLAVRARQRKRRPHHGVRCIRAHDDALRTGQPKTGQGQRQDRCGGQPPRRHGTDRCWAADLGIAARRHPNSCPPQRQRRAAVRHDAAAQLSGNPPIKRVKRQAITVPHLGGLRPAA